MAAPAVHLPATTAAGEKLSFEFLQYADHREVTRYSSDGSSDSETRAGATASDSSHYTASTSTPTTTAQSQTTHRDDSIRVRKDGFWCYCGPVLTGDHSNALPASLDTWASATMSHGQLSDSLWPFVEYANTVIKQFGLGHYWISVRATKANKEFDVPRWHTDEIFFEPGIKRNRGDRGEGRHDTQVAGTSLEGGYGKGLWKILFPFSSSTVTGSDDALGEGLCDFIPDTHWKLCTTLLGPSTKFIPREHQQRARQLQRQAKAELATDHNCVDIRCVGCAATAEAVRQRLAGDLEELGYVQAETFAPTSIDELSPSKDVETQDEQKMGRADGLWCCFFRLGPETGAVHSEPPQGGDREGMDRVFVNVVPGTEEELRELMKKWGMEFPRDWSIVKEGGGWR